MNNTQAYLDDLHSTVKELESFNVPTDAITSFIGTLSYGASCGLGSIQFKDALGSSFKNVEYPSNK